MDELIPFTYHNKSIRTMQYDDGSVWWVASDVCEVLALSNPSRACSRLDNDEKALTIGNTLRGEQEILIVSESGLYKLIMRSRKHEAKLFQRWVTHDILPQIRKTGTYGPQVKDPMIQQMMSMCLQLDATKQQAEAAKQQAEEAKAEAHEANQLAVQALLGQQWLTIAQFVTMHQLGRQMPESLQREFGKILTGHCIQQNIRMYKLNPADRPWSTETTYHVPVMAAQLDLFLRRRGSQLTMLQLHRRQRTQ